MHRNILGIGLIFLSALANIASAQSFDDATVSNERILAQLQLRGVLMGAAGGVAIINDQLVRVDEVIGDAVVLGIEAGSVNLRLGNREFMLRVGYPSVEDLDTHPSLDPQPVVAQDVRPSDSGRQPPAVEVYDDTQNLISPDDDIAALTASKEIFVQFGDTLSTIAEAHRPAHLTLKQTMQAIYTANEHAFGGSVDILMAGAVLQLPHRQAANLEHFAQLSDPAPAISETGSEPVAHSADTLAHTKVIAYRAVAQGETLSEIAVQLRPKDATLSATMTAVYQANPDCFGGDMDLLYAGATLRIPHILDSEQNATIAAMLSGRSTPDLTENRVDPRLSMHGWPL